MLSQWHFLELLIIILTIFSNSGDRPDWFMSHVAAATVGTFVCSDLNRSLVTQPSPYAHNPFLTFRQIGNNGTYTKFGSQDVDLGFLRYYIGSANK